MNLTAENMRQALECLDRHLSKPVKLIIGGGGAMLLAHQFPLVTADIDAVPAQGATVEELDALIKTVARELKLPSDWLNSYYSTFMHVLPADYGARLQTVCELPHLTVMALSKDDLLIMKCFAGRMKDRAHAKALLQKGARAEFVESHIEGLKKRNIPNADRALDFLDEVLDLV